MRWTSSWFLASLGAVAAGAGVAFLGQWGDAILDEAQPWMSFDHVQGWLVMAAFAALGIVALVLDWPRRRSESRQPAHEAGPLVVSMLASLAAAFVLILLAWWRNAASDGSRPPPAAVASLLEQLLVVRAVIAVAVVCACAAGVEAVLRSRWLRRQAPL